MNLPGKEEVVAQLRDINMTVTETVVKDHPAVRVDMPEFYPPDSTCTVILRGGKYMDIVYARP